MKSILRRSLCIALALLCLLGLTPAQAQIDHLSGVRDFNAYESIVSGTRDIGTCRMLRGEFELTVVVVSMDGENWSLGELDLLNRIVDQALRKMEEEAAAYGVTLRITPVYYRASAAGDPLDDDWYANVLASIPGLDNSSWVNRPLLFCLNVDGRSFACPSAGRDPEYVIFYMENDPGTIRHELLHLFGAEDFYFHPDVEEIAGQHFPNSVMLASEAYADVDPMTAYLVGWTSVPNAAALAFMDDISHITQEDIYNAREQDQFTGTGSIQMGSGTYYGTLEMGCANGVGMYQTPSGASYVGDWTWNDFNGRGTLTMANGDFYTGDFADNKTTGKGTYVWSSGESYTGDFVDGSRTGQGTFTWPSGETYTGAFVNGKRTGQGTYTWANGQTYTGSFLNNAMTGLGMMTFTNGDIYMGEFMDGTLHGMGTMYYADGTVKTGKWENDVYVGD